MKNILIIGEVVLAYNSQNCEEKDLLSLIRILGG
tara:strand:+ start:1201 stop:1302 length:102 start_codon:yes stop_codon:yes gene_type:complete